MQSSDTPLTMNKLDSQGFPAGGGILRNIMGKVVEEENTDLKVVDLDDLK